MSEHNKDELIEAQKEVIGILFEIIKRYQKNNELDEEYFKIIEPKDNKSIKQKRRDEITNERTENATIITRLLKKLET